MSSQMAGVPFSKECSGNNVLSGLEDIFSRDSVPRVLGSPSQAPKFPTEPHFMGTVSLLSKWANFTARGC